MKIRYFPKLPLCYAALAGISVFILYPGLLDLVAAPILGSIDESMPSERFFHRIQTVFAFSVLGFLVPLAAILNLPDQSRIRMLRRLGLYTSVSLIVAAATAWLMRADFRFIAQWLSGLQTEDPDIPTVASYAVIPLYRIAIYPSVIMLVIIIVGFFRAIRSQTKPMKTANETVE